MRIQVSDGACTGHAMCHAAAPEVYELDDDGFNRSHGVEVPRALEAAAARGRDACPERAIALSD